MTHALRERLAWVSGPEDSSCLFGGSILYELPSGLIILF